MCDVGADETCFKALVNRLSAGSRSLRDAMSILFVSLRLVVVLVLMFHQ
jgi:hypothetical protein